MKIAIVVAVAGFALSAGSAFAGGEGVGDPFPFRAPGIVTQTMGRAILPSALTDPFPFRAAGTVITTAMSGQMLPANGSEGAVQSVNSLPAGAENGTAAYASAQIKERYFQAQAERSSAARLAHQQGPVTPRG